MKTLIIDLRCRHFPQLCTLIRRQLASQAYLFDTEATFHTRDYRELADFTVTHTSER